MEENYCTFFFLIYSTFTAEKHEKSYKIKDVSKGFIYRMQELP